MVGRGGGEDKKETICGSCGRSALRLQKTKEQFQRKQKERRIKNDFCSWLFVRFGGLVTKAM